MNKVALVIAFCGLVMSGLTGCTADRAGTAERDSSGFALNILPESFAPGGSSADFSLNVIEQGADTVVQIEASGAKQLKALYLRLDYDPAKFCPLASAPGVAAGAASDLLSLQILGQRGTVWYGQVLANFDQQPGMSGDGTVATIRFRRGPAPATRALSTAPGQGSACTLRWDSASQLGWRYYNKGDYDQNGEVNIADLTPVGQHFLAQSPDGPGQPWPEEAAEGVVDGDSNGEINIADLTPIGSNFQRSCLGGYNVYASSNPDDYPSAGSLLGNVPFSAASGSAALQRKAFSNLLEGSDQLYFWVRPSDGSSEGKESNLLGNDFLPVDVSLSNPPASGSGTQADPYMLDNANNYTISVISPLAGDVSASSDTVYTATIPLDSPMGPGGNVIDLPDGTLGDFSVHITYKGEDADPPDMYFHAQGGFSFPNFYLTNPPAAGTGTLADPYLVDDSTVYVFAVLDPIDGDVSTDPLTAYSVSDGAAGSMGAGVNNLDITDGYLGEFSVNAQYSGTNTMPASIFLRVSGPPGLYLLPDTNDPDWAGVTGDGSSADPYVCSVAGGFNADFSLAFDLKICEYADGSGVQYSPADYTWLSDPPFIAQWPVPGSFTVNAMTEGEVMARLTANPATETSHLFIRSLSGF